MALQLQKNNMKEGKNMACRDALKNLTASLSEAKIENFISVESNSDRLFFGVDSKSPADNILQNNLTEYEWVLRNKIPPAFWGRNINGENALTKEEIEFLHKKGCRIAAICFDPEEKNTEESGRKFANKISDIAYDTGVPEGTTLFLEIKDDETVTAEYMGGFSDELLSEGYMPAFKANTDANYNFDKEFSKGMQNNHEAFKTCIIWATAPSLADYDNMTTSHLIHPDNWMPFAPSSVTREDIALWQYGKECHPIFDNDGNPTSFNVSLIKDKKIIIKTMF